MAVEPNESILEQKSTILPHVFSVLLSQIKRDCSVDALRDDVTLDTDQRISSYVWRCLMWHSALRMLPLLQLWELISCMFLVYGSAAGGIGRIASPNADIFSFIWEPLGSAKHPASLLSVGLLGASFGALKHLLHSCGHFFEHWMSLDWLNFGHLNFFL